jgi:putative membrane protein
MRGFAIVSLLGALAAMPAAAQPATGNPAAMAPSTPQSAPGVPAPHQPNDNDRLFVQAATIGGKAEVELGQLAELKGRSQAVKDFGRQMVADHGNANQQLMRLAQAGKIPQPNQLDDEHKAMRDQLEKLSGPEFDLAYLRGQIGDHQKTAQLFEWEIGSGQDPQLKGFASHILPVVLRHLEMALAIEDQLTATAAAPTGPGHPPGTSGRSPSR